MRIGIVCDLSPTIGAGHFMRCTALAEEFISQGHSIEMSVNPESVPLASMRVSEVSLSLKPEFTDSNQLLEWIDSSAIELVIWDSYTRSSEQSLSVKAKVPVVAIVDGVLRGQHADLYVDQNIDAHLDHANSAYEVLAGTDYAILSSQIISARRSKIRIQENLPRQVLVAMGGTDARGLAEELSKEVADYLPNVLVNVVIPKLQGSNSKSDLPPSKNLNVLNPTTKLFELIRGSDLYIGGCGTSVWEALYIGTPMACLEVADNQELTYGRLLDQGLVVGLGVLGNDILAADQKAELIAHALIDPEALNEMTIKGQEVIDGQGSKRIVAQCEQLVEKTRTYRDY